MAVILKLFFTIYLWLYGVYAFSMHALLFLILLPFTNDKVKLGFSLSKFFTIPAFPLLLSPLKIKGLENVPTDRNFIIASNHQSFLDIIIHIRALKTPISFFAKEELTKIPILGWDIKNQGHFIVDRSNPKKALKQLNMVKIHLLNGRSALIFPEGTRSTDNEVGPFKKGAFLLAAQTGVPIIPAYISGSNKAMNKKSVLTSPHSMSVSYGKPIYVKKAKSKIEEKKISLELLDIVRAKIIKMSN